MVCGTNGHRQHHLTMPPYKTLLLRQPEPPIIGSSATIGSCTATENITITTVPYPIANAGNDTTICFNTPAQLNGSHDGSSFYMVTSQFINECQYA